MNRKKRERKAREKQREERSQVERDNQFRSYNIILPSFYLKHVKHMYVVV